MDETNFFSSSAKQFKAAIDKLDCCPYCQPKQILLPLNVSLAKNNLELALKGIEENQQYELVTARFILLG